MRYESLNKSIALGIANNPKNIVFIDGYCTLCNNFIDSLIKRDRRRNLQFASLQGTTAAKMLKPTQLNPMLSVILLSGDKTYELSTASIRSIALLGGPYKLFLILLMIPPFIRNWVYRIVAKNRIRWFGKRETCRVPSEEEVGLILP